MLLRRALTNLLSNAVRYAPDGSPILVSIASEPGNVSVAVSNPGSDIPEAELQRLFSRFARRDASRGRATEGAGLGLAIVESIMKAQGGSVNGRSESGRVTFTLYGMPRFSMGPCLMVTFCASMSTLRTSPSVIGALS